MTNLLVWQMYLLVNAPSLLNSNPKQLDLFHRTTRVSQTADQMVPQRGSLLPRLGLVRHILSIDKHNSKHEVKHYMILWPISLLF